MPGYKNVIKSGVLFTLAGMLTQYQQGCRYLFGWWVKLECPKKHHKPVRYSVDMTKHNGRDIGLPDVIVFSNRKVAQKGWVHTYSLPTTRKLKDLNFQLKTSNIVTIQTTSAYRLAVP